MNEAYITLKEFCFEEAKRLGITPGSVATKVARGQYKDTLEFKRENSRVVLVKRKDTKHDTDT